MKKGREREEGRERKREREGRVDKFDRPVSNTNYTVDLVYYLGKRGGGGRKRN